MTDEELRRDRETCARDRALKRPIDSVHLSDDEMEEYNAWWDRDVHLADAARTRWPAALDEIDSLRAEVETLTRERDQALEGGRVIGRTLQHQIGVGRAEYERANRAECELREALDEIDSLRRMLEAVRDVVRERDAARAEVRRLVKALRTMHDAADFYVRWGCGVGDEDSGGSSFDRLARVAGEASTVLAGYEVDDG